MNRKSLTAGMALAALVGALMLAHQGLGRTVSAQGSSGATQVPKFRAEGSWAKLPDKWIMAIVSSTAIDEQEHLWVLQRPETLSAEEKPKAAPPVLEFDANGNFIQGWGGKSEGHPWPSSEHGIYLDPKGFVWIGGNGADDQILKFTKAGKFLMQIGKANPKKSNLDTTQVGQPADVFVHQKTNELFVADGYGNHRVIVFDADSGAFKRMWGAFGVPPVDDPPPPPAPEGGRGRGRGNASPPPQPMGPDGAPGFLSPVHAIKVSKDDLVYVADRGGRRVQIFTLAGKFVNQIRIGMECHAPDCGNGQTAAGIAFSTDPEQKYLFVANRSQAQIMIFERKTLMYLDSFGSWGSNPGQFGTLHHLSVDGKGNLYTAEVTPLKPENRRVQKFTFTGFVPLPVINKNK